MNFYLNFILIYLISNSKWILVESTNTSARTPRTLVGQPNQTNSSQASGGRTPPAIPAGPRSQGSESTSGSSSASGANTPPAVPAGPAGRSAGTQGASGTQIRTSSGLTRTSSSAQSQSKTSVTEPKPKDQRSSTSQSKPTDNSQTSQKTAPDSKQSAETKTAAQPAAKSQPASGVNSGPTATTPVNQTASGGGQAGGRTSGSSSATPPTTPKTGGSQGAGGGAATTGQSARTQQRSSGQGAGPRTGGQSSSQPSTQTPEQKPKSSPASQTGTQSTSASTASPKQSADGQSMHASQQLEKADNGASVRSPASPTSGTGDKAKKGTEIAKRTGIEVCIKNNKKATPQFNYNKSGQVVTYTAKGNNGFNVVKQKNTEIWKTDKKTEYATEVVLNGKGKKEKIVTIYLLNGTTKSYKKDGKGKEWKVCVQSNTESVTKKSNNLDSDSNLVDLDITKIKIEFYDMKFTSDIQMLTSNNVYSPKGNYLFKSVNHGSHVIWKADKPEDCSNKVRSYISNYSNTYQVWITLLDGTTKKFSKIGSTFSTGKWTEEIEQATSDSQ